MDTDGLVKIEVVLEGVEGSQEREESVEGEQVDGPLVAIEAKDDEPEPVTTNPFVVFPHEVWNKVVTALTKKNPDDAWNLIKTYPGLREEVINKREVLFYKVLPLLFPDFDKSSVLACRQVCKGWRTIVDQFLEDHPSQKPYQPETSFLNEFSYRYITLQDKNMDFMMNCLSFDFQDKLSLLEANVMPPSVVGRSASFFFDNTKAIMEMGDQTPMLTYYNSLCTLLERIGSRIETVSIPLTAQIHIMWDIQRYAGFARCLGLLPSLKVLTIDTPFDSLFFNFVDDDPDVEGVEARQFMNLAQHCPLPELRTLKILKVNAELRSFHNYFPFQDISLYVLRTYGHQIEKLCIEANAVRPFLEVPLGNLTDLQIIRMGDLYVDRMVQLLQNVDAEKLKRIEIHYARVTPKNRIFLMLQRFQQIELFGIKMYKNYFPREDDYLPSFPSVKALKLDIADPTDYLESQNPSENPNSRFPGMNLLNAFPNLEYLEIKLMDENFEKYGDMRIYQEDEIGMKLLRFKVCMGQEKGEMEIWDLLPRLKRFVVGGNRFEI